VRPDAVEAPPIAPLLAATTAGAEAVVTGTSVVVGGAAALAFVPHVLWYQLATAVQSAALHTGAQMFVVGLLLTETSRPDRQKHDCAVAGADSQDAWACTSAAHWLAQAGIVFGISCALATRAVAARARSERDGAILNA